MRTSKFLPFFVIVIGWFAICAHAQTTSSRKTAQANEAEVRQVIERWAQAFRARDLDGIMAVYAPGDAVIGYDLAPPLQYRGNAAYRKDYADFLAQYEGPLEFEARDVHVVAGTDVAFYHALERMAGKLKSGEKFDTWIRATSCLKKIHGRWLIVHDHLSVPADFETGKAVMDLKP
jgi:uncharacterized protein (TIGR02246 family)